MSMGRLAELPNDCVHLPGLLQQLVRPSPVTKTVRATPFSTIPSIAEETIQEFKGQSPRNDADQSEDE
jgi:hypothetical protein